MKRTELKRHTALGSRSALKRSPFRWRRKKSDGYTKVRRDYIRERDGWCRVCGRPGSQVHHVIPRGRFKVHPEWYTFTNLHDPINLMWICTQCHDRATYHVEDLEIAIRIQEKRFGPLRKPNYISTNRSHA